MIDTHCHLDEENYEDLNVIINEMKDNYIIASGYDIETSKNVCKLIRKYNNIYGSIGIHPSEVKKFKISDINKIEEMISDKIVAIGEIGLDYYWDENPEKEVQKRVFREQMKLAEELGLPVVIHDRDAHKDTLEIMKEFPKVRGTVHCFSGSVEFAKECVKLGYYIGITGVVTFKNAKKICDVVKEIPLDKLLVETDCPYMAPSPNRGKRNKSDYIRYIIEKIAEIKEISSKEVNLVVNGNFHNLIHNKK